jgi:preprotein translocase subunit SecG
VTNDGLIVVLVLVAFAIVIFLIVRSDKGGG